VGSVSFGGFLGGIVFAILPVVNAGVLIYFLKPRLRKFFQLCRHQNLVPLGTVPIVENTAHPKKTAFECAQTVMQTNYVSDAKTLIETLGGTLLYKKLSAGK
jgi:hypothetical protein